MLIQINKFYQMRGEAPVLYVQNVGLQSVTLQSYGRFIANADVLLKEVGKNRYLSPLEFRNKYNREPAAYN